MKNEAMRDDIYLLDANAILRYLLKDVEEQFEVVNDIIHHHYCVVSMEVLAEVTYVLNGLYQVPRSIIAIVYRKLAGEVVIQNADVLLRALEIFDQPPKLDFVDCLMYGYKVARGYNVVTFDQKLSKVLL